MIILHKVQQLKVAN